MNLKAGVSAPIFAGSVIVLLIVASVGFALYLSKPASESMTHTTTENMVETSTETMTQTTTEQMSETGSTSSSATIAIAFNASAGQMFHSGWLLIAPAGMDHYALSIHAEGLENTQAMHDVYVVEGVESSGSMMSVPIGGQNATLSEFEVGSDGVGNFFVLLNQNPFSSYESVNILFVPGMQMANATVVATASLAMAMH